MFRLFRLLAIIAAVQLLGGHWIVLQTAAWVGMTVQYAKTDSVSAALSKTFDGGHPCKMCVAVKKGRASEQEQDQFKILLKAEAVLPTASSTPQPHFVALNFPAVVSQFTLRSHAPPTPPPLA